MNVNPVIARQFRAASTRRTFHLLARRPLPVSPISLTPLLTRSVANTVSSKPASDNLKHARTNIKEEIGNSTTDLAKTIAGANPSGTETPEAPASTFVGVTRQIASQVPKPAMYFGLAGTIPYLGTSATTVYLANKASLATQGLAGGMDPGVAITVLHQALEIQITYGAVILSFLGALHWGMEFSGLGGHKGVPRYLLGIAPVLWAWPTIMLDPINSLIAQWVGFTGLWYADSKVTSRGWTPKWYSQYRFYLSILVGTCIIGTLAGTSYFGPVAGHSLVTHDLEMIREERKKYRPGQAKGIIRSGEVEAVPGQANTDHYVVLQKHKDEEKEKKEKEEKEKGKEGKEGKEEGEKKE